MDFSEAKKKCVQAVMHADTVLENINAIGIMDGDALRQHLLRHGFDDDRRWELQSHGWGDGRTDTFLGR